MRVEEAEPQVKRRKRYGERLPTDTCIACYNEERGAQPGVRHAHDLPSCRLHGAVGRGRGRGRLWAATAAGEAEEAAAEGEEEADEDEEEH